MSFRLHPHEPVAKGIRRVLLSQINAAEKRLGKQGGTPEAVHEARKSFKRIRATLRLTRSGIGEKTFQRENAAFRDIAAKLAGARDRHVLLQTALGLADAAEAEGAAGESKSLALAVAELTKALQAPEGQGAENGATSRRLTSARHALAAARKRLRRLQVEGDGFEPLAKGLRLTQRELIANMDEALKTGTDEAFHEWRKAVQRHWRHMKLLTEAWPALFEARAATARELSQVLGDDHDLSMLIAFAGDRDRSGLSERMAGEVDAACRARQTKLRAAAASLGARLAADRPKDLARHVAALWAAAAVGTNSERPTLPTD